jgi:hypothetical protein
LNFKAPIETPIEFSPQHVFLTARRNLPSGETVCGTPY